MTGTSSATELFARVAEAAPVGLAILLPPGIFEWANQAYFEMTGRDRSLIGTNLHDLPDREGSFSSPVRAALEAAFAGRGPARFRSIREPRNARPGGAHLDIEILPLVVGPGTPVRALLTVRDVTDRVEEHARALVFQQSFLTSTNPMQLTDRSGVMVDVNPAFERIYGYSRDECRGHKPNLVSSRRTPIAVYERMWADLLDPARGYWSGEIVNRDRKGRERTVLLSITAIRNDEGEATHFLGVTVDLSEQRSWELRAAHADKLASLGQLAAGVAHEINTPLANVMLLAESLRRRTSDPATRARLATMTEQVEVASRIVQGLLDFARRTEPRIIELDLVEVVRESMEFLLGKQSADVEIETDFPPGAVPISGDRGQLMQVFINILNNAYDAMGGRGQLRLTVRREARQAEVEIIDSGPGIPLEAVAHVFEPFFTTKGETGGTGLGLAICHGIVQAHHGSITARNVLGAGAGFTVVLPLRGMGRSRPQPNGGIAEATRQGRPAASRNVPGDGTASPEGSTVHSPEPDEPSRGGGRGPAPVGRPHLGVREPFDRPWGRRPPVGSDRRSASVTAPRPPGRKV